MLIHPFRRKLAANSYLLERGCDVQVLEAITVGEVVQTETTVQDIDWAQTDGDPNENIGVAMRRLGTRDIGRLPVVARDNPRRLLGVLRRVDVVRAYDVALTRRTELRHRMQPVRLGAISGAQVEEIIVEAGAPCDGKRVAEVTSPRNCVLATVRRGWQVMIPQGGTLGFHHPAF